MHYKRRDTHPHIKSKWVLFHVLLLVCSTWFSSHFSWSVKTHGPLVSSWLTVWSKYAFHLCKSRHLLNLWLNALISLVGYLFLPFYMLSHSLQEHLFIYHISSGHARPTLHSTEDLTHSISLSKVAGTFVKPPGMTFHWNKLVVQNADFFAYSLTDLFAKTLWPNQSVKLYYLSLPFTLQTFTSSG